MESYLKEMKISFENQNVKHQCFKVVDSKDSYQILKDIIGDSIDVHETMIAVFFNADLQSIGWFKVSQGGIDHSVADLRMIFAAALKCLATRVMICHNHPSGSLRPSQADIKVTKEIKEAGNLMRVQLLDHIIVTERGYYSFADEGML